MDVSIHATLIPHTPVAQTANVATKAERKWSDFVSPKKSLIFRDEFLVIFYAAVFQFRAFFDRKYCRFEPLSLQSRPGIFCDFFQHAGKNAGFLYFLTLISRLSRANFLPGI